MIISRFPDWKVVGGYDQTRKPTKLLLIRGNEEQKEGSNESSTTRGKDGVKRTYHKEGLLLKAKEESGRVVYIPMNADQSSNGMEVVVVVTNNGMEVVVVVTNNGMEVVVVVTNNGMEVVVVVTNNGMEVVVVVTNNGMEVVVVVTNNGMEVVVVVTNNGMEVVVVVTNNGMEILGAISKVCVDRPQYTMGASTLTVPAELHADNRLRLLGRLRGKVPPKSVVLLQGGESCTRYCSDVEPVFRQVGTFCCCMHPLLLGCGACLQAGWYILLLYAPITARMWSLSSGRLVHFVAVCTHYCSDVEPVFRQVGTFCCCMHPLLLGCGACLQAGWYILLLYAPGTAHVWSLSSGSLIASSTFRELHPSSLFTLPLSTQLLPVQLDLLCSSWQSDTVAEVFNDITFQLATITDVFTEGSCQLEVIVWQESYFHWTFGVTEPDCYGAIDVDSGESYLFFPELPESYAVWMGRLTPLEEYKARYQADYTYYTSQVTCPSDVDTSLSLMTTILLLTSSQQGPTCPVCSNSHSPKKGKNSDSGKLSKEATFDGIKNRVYKSAAEVEVIRYANQISSMAHKEILVSLRLHTCDLKLAKFSSTQGWGYHGSDDFIGPCSKSGIVVSICDWQCSTEVSPADVSGHEEDPPRDDGVPAGKHLHTLLLLLRWSKVCGLHLHLWKVGSQPPSHCPGLTPAASGLNSSILHYGHSAAPNDKAIKDGDMCLVGQALLPDQIVPSDFLFDMGCEYNCYTSDITCSFPANGKFTSDQKIIYNAVLRANREVMATAKPGVSWVDMHLLAERTILTDLKEAQILRGDVDEMMAARLGAIFMPHGLGHFMGCDVHDVHGYPEDGPSRRKERGLSSLRTARRLEQGMVLTIEPGCYFIDAVSFLLNSSPIINGQVIELWLYLLFQAGPISLLVILDCLI
ncbi:PEPD [Cordylochernes scorpioides]|uniref:Xaa-Pro dipeptidase n=1 Tax=Cordylochernes scorpioides TaxID=51811 RepID=A0ABY6K585_9ARAC|nr:PEPD [Cordylochernes scorpioides]